MAQTEKSKGCLARLMEYVTGRHKKAFALVLVSVVVSVAGGLAGSLFIQVIIDNYIMRMVETGENLFGGLLLVLIGMAVVYAVGAAGTWLYSRTMAVIAQSVLKETRDDFLLIHHHCPGVLCHAPL